MFICFDFGYLVMIARKVDENESLELIHLSYLIYNSLLQSAKIGYFRGYTEYNIISIDKSKIKSI